MPLRLALDPRIDDWIAGHDWVVGRRQALAWGITRHALDHRLASGQWQQLLPSVYLAHRGEPHRRQRQRAALIWAGPDAALDADDACRHYGLTVPAASEVRVLVPQASPARSRWFVVVRRTSAPFARREANLLSWADPATAVVGMTRRCRHDRPVLAAASEVLQKRLATYDELLTAHLRGPRRGAARFDRAVGQLAAGVASVAEADARRIFRGSHVLPPPIYNAWLRLPGGRRVCADALFLDAGLVHNSPDRLRREPFGVLEEVERCWQRLRGSGLPAGVTLVADKVIAV
jgi:hypothetical protein